MKKIKLVGIKKGWFGREIQKIVADIYVQDGKVIVESKYPKIKEELQKELDLVAYTTGAFGIRKCRYIKDKKGNETDIQLIQINQKPGDPKFLEAVLDSWFWDDKKFDGFEIYETISKIVEE